MKPQLFAQLAHRNAGFAIFLVTDDEVDQFRTLSSSRLRRRAVAFRLLRFRLLDLAQGGVNRGSQLLDVSRDQVRTELSLRVLVQCLDEGLLRRLLRASSLRQPDQPPEVSAPATRNCELVLMYGRRLRGGTIGHCPVAFTHEMD